MDFDKKELLRVLGRIKYMQQSGMEGAPPYTKTMLKRAAEHKINIDKIEPIEVDLTPLDQSKKQRADNDSHRIYEYYVNDEYMMTGTKKEISRKHGVSVYMIERLSSQGKTMYMGRGNRGSGDTHSCKCLGTIGELRKSGKIPVNQ